MFSILFWIIQKNKPEISTLTDIHTLCDASAADDYRTCCSKNKKLLSLFVFYRELAATSERVKYAQFLKEVSPEMACLIPIVCGINVQWVTLYKYNHIDCFFLNNVNKSESENGKNDKVLKLHPYESACLISVRYSRTVHWKPPGGGFL